MTEGERFGSDGDATACRRVAGVLGGLFPTVILGLDPRIHATYTARMAGYVYIVTNQKYGTLYIGVTSNIERRIYEHREGLTPGFSSKYGCALLVWYEEHDSIGTAIQREKSLKRWYRHWKIELIEAMNPEWRDLYLELW
jgi:putative endonuclease